MISDESNDTSYNNLRKYILYSHKNKKKNTLIQSLSHQRPEKFVVS